jgi:hypothetical protein
MLKPIISIVIAGLATASVTCAQAHAWGCSRSFSGSGRYGGSFSHSGSTSGGFGDFSHSGSTTYTRPDGQTYSGSHSGSGTYGYGGASYHGSYSNSYGGSASYSGSASYGGSGCYYGYHGYSYPAPYCGSTGGAFAAGAVTGALVGAAVASSSQPAPVYVAPAPGVYVQPAPVVVTTPSTTVVTSGPLVVGTTVSALPVGFQPMNVNGVQYYQSGSTWYQMRVVGSSVSYVVVPTP